MANRSTVRGVWPWKPSRNLPKDAPIANRQAADAVCGRIDWKYALSLKQEDAGFDASILCESGARLTNSRLVRV